MAEGNSAAGTPRRARTAGNERFGATRQASIAKADDGVSHDCSINRGGAEFNSRPQTMAALNREDRHRSNDGSHQEITMRRLTTLLTLCLALPLAHTASAQDQALSQLLEKVARESSVGTPRAINSDLLDEGYSVDGNELVNHLSVQPRHAAQMRDNPKQVRTQLAASVCNNEGLRQLMSQGAVLRFEFSEYQSKKPITTERYRASDC
tara:strand:+ start:24872 stop:25495 length:624 start_codon:yes stop_codon:yes gene_type:complete